VGDFIDAKDSQGDWRVGYIVDKNDMTKTFKVRFDGWSGKYDEVHKPNNLVLPIQQSKTEIIQESSNGIYRAKTAPCNETRMEVFFVIVGKCKYF
jgi:glutathionyl-hydroquinone reductase